MSDIYPEDYIPPTEDVMSSYITAEFAQRGRLNYKALEAEFYRWLEHHDTEVAKATEERIVELLEKHAKSFISARYDGNLRNYHIKFDTDRFTAEIKGENK